VDVQIGGIGLRMDYKGKWKPNLKIIKAIIQFVMKTGRFQLKAIEAEEVGITEKAEAA